MTEVPGHVIDPNGDARRALQEAVAEHGPEALSNAVIMYNVCRDRLIGLPGESILIGSAARSDVPALLRSLIPRLGNYGAIQAVAATLAEEHELDVAACLWVVREFARALGHIAPGPATGGSGSFLGPGPRPGSGPAPRPLPGPIPVQAADSEELTAQVAVFRVAPAPPASGPAQPPAAAVTGEGGKAGEGGVTGAAETEAAAGEGAESEGSENTVIVSALAGGASDEGGATPGGAQEDGGTGGEDSPTGTAEGSRAEGSGVGESGASAGEAEAIGAAASGAAASGAAEGGRAVSESFASGGPGSDSPGGGAWGGPPPGGGVPGGGVPWGGLGGGGAGSPGGPGLPPRGPGGPGVPPPGGPQGPPGRQPERSRVFSRNTLGVAAAIALVAGYLGVAAVAHLSPFPAKTVAATSSQSPGTQSSGTGTSTSASPNGSPDASPDASPTSDYQILLAKIPSAVRGQDNCRNAGTGFGATAVSQCSGLHGLAAGTVLVYYLYPSPAAVTTGFSSLLKKANFSKRRECTANDRFIDFLVDCESGFTSTTPNVTGTIAEYTNTSNQPVIVSSASRQDVMAVMVGTNDGDLLAYWKQLTWIVS